MCMSVSQIVGFHCQAACLLLPPCRQLLCLPWYYSKINQVSQHLVESELLPQIAPAAEIQFAFLDPYFSLTHVIILPHYPTGHWWETGPLPVQGDQVCQLSCVQLQFVSGERLHLWALPKRTGHLPLPGERHPQVQTPRKTHYHYDRLKLYCVWYLTLILTSLELADIMNLAYTSDWAGRVYPWTPC